MASVFQKDADLSRERPARGPARNGPFVSSELVQLLGLLRFDVGDLAVLDGAIGASLPALTESVPLRAAALDFASGPRLARSGGAAGSAPNTAGRGPSSPSSVGGSETRAAVASGRELAKLSESGGSIRSPRAPARCDLEVSRRAHRVSWDPTKATRQFPKGVWGRGWSAPEGSGRRGPHVER